MGFNARGKQAHFGPQRRRENAERLDIRPAIQKDRSPHRVFVEVLDLREPEEGIDSSPVRDTPRAEAPLELAVREGIAAIFIERTEEGFPALETPAYETYVSGL